MTLQEDIDRLEKQHADLENDIQEAIKNYKPDPVVSVLKKTKLRTKEKLDALKEQLAAMG